MKIALFPKLDKEESKKIALETISFLVQKGLTVAIDDEKAKILNITPISDFSSSEFDFVISMGGDGTILRLLHTYPDLSAPIIGINLGHLGFMADITLNEINPALQDLLDGKYRIEERIMMLGRMNGKTCFAVNDFVLHRSFNPSLVEFAINVNGDQINTFEADGIIVATPNGSTAYSLAAGGPILLPELNAFIITPICPHTISNRPIVLSTDKQIEVTYLSRYDPIEVVADGINHFKMNTEDTIEISLHHKKFKIVCLDRHPYFATLRTKLGWVGKLR